MKLAHIADPHLGIRQYHRQTPTGINQREADVGNAFRDAIDGVIAVRPDAVVVAGDLFHSVRPSNAAIVFAFRQFQRLREALPDAPIVLIAGNHDTPRSAETGSILRLFEELRIDVAYEAARRLVYPALDLSVLAVPHKALMQAERPVLRPEGAERHQVLVIHGEHEGVMAPDRDFADYGGAPITAAELGAGEWTYVAFGHYHVQLQIGPRTWYAGALDYVSNNVWGELRDEAAARIAGKGWLFADLDSGVVERQAIARSRDVIDLPPIAWLSRSAAELDAAIAASVATIRGGVADKIVRLVIHGVPRHVARELDHTAIRALKASALHFHLDTRRPELRRESGSGAPGRRRTLPEIVRDYLERRPLPAELDRARFVALGTDVMASVERELSGG